MNLLRTWQGFKSQPGWFQNTQVTLRLGHCQSSFYEALNQTSPAW